MLKHRLLLTPLPAKGLSGADLQNMWAVLRFFYAEEWQAVFEEMANEDFERFDIRALSREESKGFLSFLSLAEAFIPLALEDPLAKQIIPAVVWRGLSNLYQGIAIHKPALERRVRESGPSMNEYLKESAAQSGTIEEQIRAQQATKPQLKLESILGQWPGEESYEELLEMLL